MKVKSWRNLTERRPLQLRVEVSGPGSQGWETMTGPTYLLYLLLISLVTADGLVLSMKEQLISVLRDDNVTIPCAFSDYDNNKTINVHWNQSQNGNNAEVYRYIPGRPQAFRPESYMGEESEIKKGNAALHILRAQFSDDGEYTCTVIVTPKSGEGKSTLQVSAVPTAALIPGDAIKVELGSEKSVGCEVRNFYPKDINIRWLRHEKDSSECTVMERAACTGDADYNTDGTFNIISHLTLNPTVVDDGCKYSCVVKHRSLHPDLMMNFTLTVTEREDNSGTVVAAVIGTIFTMALLFTAVFLYYQVFKKDPPSVSEITGNDDLIDMSRTTLTCHITNFKPKDLEISVCLKRRDEEMKTIHTWKSRDHASSPRGNAGDGSVVIDVELQSLMNGDVNHTQRPLHLDMAPVITPNRSRLLRCITWQRLSTYSCQCYLHITPSFSEDNRAELSVHVSHPALKAPVNQKRTLRVIGVAPTLLKIVSPAHVTHEELTTLTCPINAFKPKTLQITWLKKDQDDGETDVITWNSDDRSDVNDDVHKVIENENKDASYSFQSALTMRPSVRDDGVKYVCRTFHPATGQRAEQELVMAITAVPVLDPIKQVQDKGYTGNKVYLGKKMQLSCKIHSFYPEPIEVTWYTEDRRLLSSDIADPISDQSGLYQVTSTMTYSPTVKDLRKTITCEVKHQSTRAARRATWKLEEMVSDPKVTEIRCRPPTPECDKMAKLSCAVTELYPIECVVHWYKGTNQMKPDMCRANFEEDPQLGSFKGTVALNFIADTGCHEEEFRMELIHSGKTIDRRFRLILEGFPVLGDIVSEPSDPSYGQSVILRCKVTNSNPQDIKVKWLKGEKPLEKGQGEEKHITEKDGSISYSLQITTTALDYAKAYTCSVKHKGMTIPIKKNHYLTLPDKAPRFSDITVRPQKPVAGKEATFTVTISGFSPDIRVKWYKDFNPFPSDVVTTSDPRVGKDFLLTCSSSLRFTPQDSDHKVSVRCEVTHSVTKKVYEQPYTLHLAGRNSDEPEEHHSRQDSRHGRLALKTRVIQCLTESPRVGGDVTLTCYVDGCDADHSAFSWKKGLYPIDSGIQNKTLEDGSGSLSTITFTAQEADRDCTITCEVTYNLETQEEHFTLKLL